MGEPVVDTATGQVQEVPAAALGDLLLAGQVAPAADARVPVVVDDGSVQTVAAADLKQALDVGWHVASSQEVQESRDRERFASTGAQVRAAGEAGLRGLTLGLSDKALVELGVDSEGLLKRKELNPTTSVGFEVAGALAPILLSGGTAGAAEGAGLLARAGAETAGVVRGLGVLPRAVAEVGAVTQGGLRAALGEGLLARGVAGAGAGAVEGGLYGLGQAVSESALQDLPLASERILSHVGTGAMFGGVAGGVLGSTAAAVEKHVVPKVKELFSVENLEAMADRAGLRQWAQGRGKGLFKKLRRDFGRDAEAVIGKTVREEGLDRLITEGSTWDEIHAATRERARSAGRRIGDDLKAIDAAVPDAAPAATLNIARRASDEILDPLRSSGLRSDKNLAGQLKREFEWLWLDEASIKAELVEQAAARGKKLQGAALNRAAEQRAMQLREQFTPSFEKLHELRARIDDVAYPKGGADPTPYQKSLQQLRGVVEDEITAAADKAAASVSTNVRETYSANKQRYRSLRWLQDAAENNAASELANRTVSLTDNIWGSTITAATFTRLLAGDVGALGSMVLSAVAGVGAATLNKYLREQGQGLAARTGQKIAALVRANEAAGKTADNAVTQFFKLDNAQAAAPIVAARTGSEGKAETLAASFERRAKSFDDFMTAPEARMGKALGDTDQTAPTLAQEIRGVTMRAAGFLDEKRPRARTRVTDLQAHLDKNPRMSDSEMARWLRYADAVENPRGVLDDFAKGRMTREGAEALRVVYPRLHEQLAQQVEQQIRNSEKLVPYQKLVQLSILLDRPLHPSLEPDFIAMCQEVHAAAREQQAQAARRGGGGGGGRQNFASGQATDSQRLEASQ